MKFMISLSSVEEVKRFVDTVSGYPCEVDVCSGRYVVNGKSIMGLFSLDLSHPAQVEVLGTTEQAEEIRQALAEFVR